MSRTKAEAVAQMRALVQRDHGLDDLDVLRVSKRLPVDLQQARWDCFALLRGRGWTCKRIAAFFGINEVTVLYGLNTTFRARRKAADDAVRVSRRAAGYWQQRGRA